MGSCAAGRGSGAGRGPCTGVAVGAWSAGAPGRGGVGEGYPPGPGRWARGAGAP